MNLRDHRIEISTLKGGRDYQQDAATWLYATDPNPKRGDSYIIACVADGCGSGSGSGIIATDAIRTATMITAAYGPDRLHSAIDATRRIINDQHPDRDEHDNTTMVLATVDNYCDLQIGWSGDSRAYVLDRWSRLHRLTTDHNLANVGAPNVLTRSLLGHSGHDCDYDTEHCSTHQPETVSYTEGGLRHEASRVLLCTDGVCGVLTDNEIRQILSEAPNARRAARRLTGTAVRRAAGLGDVPDNATALVIDLNAIEV